jgi:DNA-binding Lrp family transcriptional regulator
VPKPRNTKLSVFKGREAKLNRAIFQGLALKGTQTIYGIHKQVRSQRGLRCTRYASANKRVKALEESGYIKRVGAKKTKAGFEATIYELTSRAYLAILLDSMSHEFLIARMDEAKALVAPAAILENL